MVGRAAPMRWYIDKRDLDDSRGRSGTAQRLRAARRALRDAFATRSYQAAESWGSTTEVRSWRASATVAHRSQTGAEHDVSQHAHSQIVDPHWMQVMSEVSATVTRVAIPASGHLSLPHNPGTSVRTFFRVGFPRLGVAHSPYAR
jgi:hypothetical protein